jgi:hypothetical protein
MGAVIPTSSAQIETIKRQYFLRIYITYDYQQTPIYFLNDIAVHAYWQRKFYYVQCTHTTY